MPNHCELPRNISYGDVERAHVEHILDACGISTCGHHNILDALEQIRDELEVLNHARRLLIGYARDNTQPPRHTLKMLADATGMSISGVRTAYDGADLAQLLDILYPVTPSEVPGNTDSGLTDGEKPR